MVLGLELVEVGGDQQVVPLLVLALLGVVCSVIEELPLEVLL